MKKLVALVFIFTLLSSCNVNNAIEFTSTTNINESIMVSIPQTNSVAFTYSETVTQDLNQVISNFNDITSVNIDALSYKFKNVDGNENAVIQSATIIINGNTVTSISNVNIAQEAASATVFPITDTVILNQLETLFLSNSSVTIEFSGMGISDEGPISFEIEVSIGLTVSI